MNKEQLIESIKKGRENLVDFRHIILTIGDDECNSAPFHYEWSDILLNGQKHVAIEAFRESAKTQLVLRAFPLYCLTFPSSKLDYIVIIKNTQTQARNKLKEIQREFFSNPVCSANVIKVNEQSGDIFSVDVKSEEGEIINVRIEAYGKGASIRGLANVDRRPKIVIIDDPQDFDDARSDTILESDWNWFLSDVMFLGQYTRIFMIANNLGERCIGEQVSKHREELNFDFKRVPISNDQMTTSSWEAKYSIADIKREKEAYISMGKLDIWLRERMCLSVDEETRVFKEHYYCWYSPGLMDQIASNSSVYATLDPASSTKNTACFRAIVVNAVQPDGHWYILEIAYGRWDTIELIEQIFRVVPRWGVIRFGIEKGMLQQTYESLLYREQTKRNIRFQIEALEHGKVGNKLERIKALSPRFKSRSVWFPDYAPWLAELKSELAGVTKDDIKSEFIDLVDALAMQEQLARSPYQGAPTNRLKRENLQLEAIR